MTLVTPAFRLLWRTFLDQFVANESATSDLQHWRVRFTNGLTLTIQAATWKEQAFLAFQPWKAPGT